MKTIYNKDKNEILNKLNKTINIYANNIVLLKVNIFISLNLLSTSSIVLQRKDIKILNPLIIITKISDKNVIIKLNFDFLALSISFK